LTALLVSAPGHGSLNLSANGGFSYQPAAGYAGSDSFTYRASDGQLGSSNATVTITVTSLAANTPPVAVNDSYAAPVRRSGSYPAQVLDVLANDYDPDGSLNPASVVITSAPNKGGSVTVNADGTLSYVPRLRFSGIEAFKYKVRDTLGARSNAATVSVRVR
jgi:hypothetical protein